MKGAGDLATGVAARLWRSGFPVIMTEIDRPLTGRRTVSLSEAMYEGKTKVEMILMSLQRNPNYLALMMNAIMQLILPILDCTVVQAYN
jgi:hypothetical protein